MRVLVISLNYRPEIVGVGKYSSELAEWFAAEGNEVRVICGPPYFPEWRVQQGYHAWRFSASQEGGARVCRVPVWIPANPTGLARLAHVATFGVSVFAACMTQLGWRPDVVVMMEPTLSAVPAGILLSRITRAGTWIHAQDLEVDAAFKLGLLPDVLRSVVSRIERLLLSRCSLVTSISEAMVQQVIAKGVPIGRTALLRNWVDTREIDPSDRAEDMRVRLGCDSGTTLVLYAGSIGAKQGIETLAEALELLPQGARIRVVVCSDGPTARAFQERCAEAGLSNVGFIPLQPARTFVRLLTAADVHVLLEEPGATDLVMPSKLAGMLASGRPVVAAVSREGSVARLVREIGCGVIAEPGDASGIAGAMVCMAGDAGLRQAMGERGRVYAEAHLDKQPVLRTATSLLERVRRSSSSGHGERPVAQVDG